MRRILSSKRPKGSIKPIAIFDGMGMNNKVLRGVKKPSEIQQRAVLPILKGRDVIAQAQSGTGKTSMIAISVCQIGNTSSRKYVSLFELNMKKLEHGVHAVSGTPGRVVYDMIKRGSLQTKSVKLLILDESDEMLSKGLKDQIYDVYSWPRFGQEGVAINFVKNSDMKTLCDIERYYGTRIREMPADLA
ncbi:hypothetical protein F2Q68_00014318 [Brassica cretica]|uniref:Helicase ATP-binding domain-containing protein n=2 Tax=Brassica cretica TaxID=69181 RepID=A0A8S9HFY5_BRACR|nr:hypothetical protein F2Q68_00014318 [Brassica cretica]KAF3606692.1 hypothetical protein DY000_02046796 [Brassica cretica]